jgi:hypothetical protein
MARNKVTRVSMRMDDTKDWAAVVTIGRQDKDRVYHVSYEEADKLCILIQKRVNEGVFSVTPHSWSWYPVKKRG